MSSRITSALIVLSLTCPIATQALPTLSLSHQGGGLYYIELTVDEAGVSFVQWNVTSTSGVPDLVDSLAYGFSVLPSDPSCNATGMGNHCTFSGGGPFPNPLNPSGLNNYAVFLVDRHDALYGAPNLYNGVLGVGLTPPIVVGAIQFTNAGGEGTVSIPPSSIVVYPGPASEPALLYEVDFGTPPHTSGDPPAVGSGPTPRETVSELNFGTPEVVPTFELLTDQPLLFDNSMQQVGDQIQFNLDTGGGLPPVLDYYCIEAQVLISETLGDDSLFAIHHDSPGSDRIEFIDGVIYAAGVPVTPIGSYVRGEVIEVRSEIDLEADNWRVSLDGIEAHSESFSGILDSVRFSVAVSMTEFPGSVAAVDNIRISSGECLATGVDVPSGSITGWILLLMALPGVVALRTCGRRRSAQSADYSR